MKTRNWKHYLPWILFTEAVGALSGWFARDGIQRFSETALQPKLTPPAVLFPIVWSLLYGLMGISAAKIYEQPASRLRSAGLNLFIIQLVVNFFWSPIFFQTQAYGFSLIWLLILWILVFCMIVTFYKTDKTAALLQIPYLLWLTFADYLNWAVWKLNA